MEKVTAEDILQMLGSDDKSTFVTAEEVLKTLNIGKQGVVTAEDILRMLNNG